MWTKEKPAFEMDAHVCIVNPAHPDCGTTGTLCVFFDDGSWIFRPDGVEMGGVGHLWVKQDEITLVGDPDKGD